MQLISGTTAAEALINFHGPGHIAVAGLAGVETVELFVPVGGVDVPYNVGPDVQTLTGDALVIFIPGAIQLKVKVPATAGPVTVAYWG